MLVRRPSPTRPRLPCPPGCVACGCIQGQTHQGQEVEFRGQFSSLGGLTLELGLKANYLYLRSLQLCERLFP